MRDEGSQNVETEQTATKRSKARVSDLLAISNCGFPRRTISLGARRRFDACADFTNSRMRRGERGEGEEEVKVSLLLEGHRPVIGRHELWGIPQGTLRRGVLGRDRSKGPAAPLGVCLGRASEAMRTSERAGGASQIGPLGSRNQCQENRLGSNRGSQGPESSSYSRGCRLLT